jgi:hypothetical protein
MSKSDELRKLYGKIELDSTDGRQLLSKVKNGIASKEEIDDLLDFVKASKNGAKTLDDIKNFENALITSIEKHFEALKKIENEYFDVAHYEDESKKDRLYADMKKRYKRHTAKSEEIIEAIKKAYFQVDNYDQFENRLYKIKETLSFLE